MSLDDSRWFTEVYEARTAFSVKYTERVFQGASKFQKVEIFETDFMGRVLALDGLFMVTMRDHFIYHEMLVHPAMEVLSDPRKVLVIGGGDGGTVTELVKHPGLESIILCEIDEMVVSACREFMPEVSAGLEDPRVTTVFEDGAAFVRQHSSEFDLILVDSSDPIGPGVVLFDEPFYESVKGALKREAIAVFQTESPMFMEETFCRTVKRLRKVFRTRSARPYFAVMPSYPGGLWSFTFSSEVQDPLEDAPAELSPCLQGKLRYYDTRIHKAAFAMPVFVKEALSNYGKPTMTD